MQWRVSRRPSSRPPAPRRPSRARTGCASKAGADPMERLPDHDLRRHRCRDHLPQQGPRDVGDARCGVRQGAVPRLERLGVGAVRRLPRPHVAGRGHRHRRPRGLDRRGASACAKLGFRVLDPAVQADLGRRTTSITRTTTCRSSIRCGPRSRTPNLPITFHVSTGRDPRAARGNGGAVINYVSHSLSPTIEPVANLCASGVLERFPQAALRHHRGRHRLGAVAARARWTRPTSKHHFWVRPKLKSLPSDYYRDARLRLVPGGHGRPRARRDATASTDNFMWANDYPHHEGTWPHSAEAIERTMGAALRRRAGQGARAELRPLPRASRCRRVTAHDRR